MVHYDIFLWMKLTGIAQLQIALGKENPFWQLE